MPDYVDEINQPKVARVSGLGRHAQMSSIMVLRDRTSLITGASSGIGRALAVVLARRGSHLALADIDTGGLEETARLAGIAASEPIRISRHKLDVADGPAVAALPDAIKVTHSSLDLLLNNAGVALGGSFEQVAEEDFDWLFSINFFGAVRMIRAFLPMLRESQDARIVNVSSVFGLIATPGQTAYTASKFALRGFSESLRHELAGSRVGVTTVHPGGIATAIATSARVPRGIAVDEADRQRRAFAAFLTLSPATAAEAIVSGVERRRARVIVGRDAKFAATIERLMPVGYWGVLKRLNGRSRRPGAAA